MSLAVPSVAQAQESPAASISSVELQLASEIIDTAYPQDTREPMFMAVSEQMEQQVMASVIQQMGDLPAGARKVLHDWQATVTSQQRDILRRHIPAIMQAWAESYANIFSENELRDILTFVQTDTGRTFLMKSTDVISDPAFASANQAYIDESMALMQDRMPDLIRGLSEIAEAQ
ncbi:DUF2059 domain-containing protein [Aurantiacibacter zhengii]|uniref:DUF2059 domain-containing protein n=1 Tax=Aurantiacibacter zhengii TaxID=2307003 RepID=A0A418NWD4_9SPHN|nr:DUF2059 domain-containing protein [Aurantiacibacter zhengii]RIV88937.1 DUF2059 domain-containing protein [Aurantiacibacter zhengii]